MAGSFESAAWDWAEVLLVPAKDGTPLDDRTISSRNSRFPINKGSGEVTIRRAAFRYQYWREIGDANSQIVGLDPSLITHVWRDSETSCHCTALA